MIGKLLLRPDRAIFWAAVIGLAVNYGFHS